MSSPKTVTDPEVGRSNPSRMERVVVLPAPLPPSSAIIEPSATEKPMESTAVTSPKRLVRLSTVATAVTGDPVMDGIQPGPGPPMAGRPKQTGTKRDDAREHSLGIDDGTGMERGI